MAILPDLASAALYAVVVFLLVLGFLVVFIESIPSRRLSIAILAAIVLAVGLMWVGEVGIAFLVAGVGSALLANHGFEWLTTQ